MTAALSVFVLWTKHKHQFPSFSQEPCSTFYFTLSSSALNICSTSMVSVCRWEKSLFFPLTGTLAWCSPLYCWCSSAPKNAVCFKSAHFGFSPPLHTYSLLSWGSSFFLACSHQTCEAHVQPNGASLLPFLRGGQMLPCHYAFQHIHSASALFYVH